MVQERTQERPTSSVRELIDLLGDCLTPETARRLVELRTSPQFDQRVEELADKCNEGLLSEEERDEYDAIIHFGNVIAILQAKSRKLLSRRTGE